MKTLAVKVTLVGVMLAGAFASGMQAQAGAGTPLQDLLAKENALASAQKNKDAGAIERQVAGDFVGIGTNGQTSGRDDMLESLNETTLQEYTIYNAELVAAGEGAAILTYDVMVRVAGGDSPVPRYQHVSSLWAGRDGAWKLEFRQASAKKWGN